MDIEKIVLAALNNGGRLTLKQDGTLVIEQMSHVMQESTDAEVADITVSGLCDETYPDFSELMGSHAAVKRGAVRVIMSMERYGRLKFIKPDDVKEYYLEHINAMLMSKAATIAIHVDGFFESCATSMVCALLYQLGSTRVPDPSEDLVEAVAAIAAQGWTNEAKMELYKRLYFEWTGDILELVNDNGKWVIKR